VVPKNHVLDTTERFEPNTVLWAFHGKHNHLVFHIFFMTQTKIRSTNETDILKGLIEISCVIKQRVTDTITE